MNTHNGKPATSRKSACDRKSEIVGHMLALADSVGPSRISTNDVARAVGLTQAAIFRHFPTKNDLWRETADEIATSLRAAWDAACDAAMPPEARLRALLDAQLARISEWPALPAIICSRELNGENPSLRDTFKGLAEDLQSRIMVEISALQADGTYRAELDPADAAAFLLSIVQGLALRWCLGARATPVRDEGNRLVARQLALYRRAG